MAKVTVHHEPTPSEQIVRAANETHTVTDLRGRKIALRKMKPLDRLKMFEVIGSGNSDNQFYLGYASLAFHVASIDGDPVNRPVSKRELEALVQRLDDDGMDAVAEGIEKHFTPKKAEDDTKEQIKKRVDHPELNCSLYLVKNGVDLDVALSLPPDEAMAWAIIFGQFEGSVWDWHRMAWKDRDT